MFILYSEDHEFHKNCIRKVAVFLERVCNCKVILDMWESNAMKIDGKKSWVCYQITTADKVLIISSKGTLQKSYFQTIPGSKNSEEFGSAFFTGYRFASDEFDSDPTMLSSKYVLAYFEYSDKGDVLPDMQHVARYEIPTNLEQLYFRLHDVKQYTPRSSRRVLNLAPDSYVTGSSEGLALQQAIDGMKNLIRCDPDWYEQSNNQIGPDADSCASLGAGIDEGDDTPDPFFFHVEDDDASSTYSDCFDQIYTDLYRNEQYAAKTDLAEIHSNEQYENTAEIVFRNATNVSANISKLGTFSKMALLSLDNPMSRCSSFDSGYHGD